MTAHPPHRFLSGPRISPPALTGAESAADLVDHAFLAYNGARLREGARLLAERMLEDDVTVALSITGALTPAGLGMSAIIPLMEAGFVRSEEHTSELQSRVDLVCRLLLEKKKNSST